MKPPLAPELPEFAREVGGAAGCEDDRGIAELLARLTPSGAPPDLALRERLLGAVAQAPVRYAPFWDRLSAMFDLDDTAIEQVLREGLTDTPWELAMPGVELWHFTPGASVAGADAGLVRIRPGLAFPRHRHLGTERVLVLQGGFRDDSGRLCLPGDIAEMAPGTTHGYLALNEEPLLFALLLYGGIQIVEPT